MPINAKRGRKRREREREKEEILVSPPSRGEKKDFPSPSVMMALFKITCVVNGVSS